MRAEIALAATLAEQPGRAQHDRVRQRLAHVVHRQRRDRGAGQRFHLHAGAVGGGDGAFDPQLALGVPVDGDAAAVDRQRMAERDQFMRALHRQGTGDDRGFDDAALGAPQPAGAQLRGDGGREAHAAFGHGRARGHRLGRDIDHCRPAIAVDVRQSLRGPGRHQPPTRYISTCRRDAGDWPRISL
jgi:hypothetical protein